MSKYVCTSVGIKVLEMFSQVKYSDWSDNRGSRTKGSLIIYGLQDLSITISMS